MVKYTDKQKAQYYKNKLQQQGKRMRKNYNKPYKYPGAGQRIGSAVGGYIAPGIGSSVGGALGRGAHAAVKTITGFGDYQISKNSVVYNNDAVPKFTHANPRCTIVAHREFITDIRSSENYEGSIFTINPGNPKTFPWLSNIAANYEEYIFQGIVFEYKTNSATSIGSTNTALGTVAIATQYNSLAPSFTSKHQIENYEFSNSCVPCESMLHAIECDPSLGNDVKYIFNERDSDENADPRNYNLGKTTIATQGMQAASTIGELWVSYKVCLMKPRLGYNDNIADCYKMPTTINASFPLGTTPLIPSAKNIGFTTQDLTGALNRLYLDPGFSGVIRAEVVYNLASNGGSFQVPQIDVGGGNITDVSSSYIGVNAGRPTINVTDTQHYIAYFDVAGGYNSAGNPPSIVVYLMGSSAVTFNDSYINIMAVPSQCVYPEYP